MNDIPIICLRKETKHLISALLNPKKIIPSERGLSRDWHGLAQLCEIGGEKIPNIKRSNDPTLKVLEIWLEKSKTECTIGKLLSFLEALDRFDIIDDITPLLEKDVDYYRGNPNGFNVDLQDIDDKDIITYDDAERKRAGLPPQTYDAFVLFDNDDIGFATEIITTMESQYNMRLCIKDRDVVGGGYNHDSVIRLISTRCNRVIVVVSPSFLDSPTNKYFYTLAQTDGIEKQSRKIIPCLYKKCPELPLVFRAYHILDYTRAEKLFGNFWDHLYKSLNVVLLPSPKLSTVALPKEEVNPRRMSETPKPTNHVQFDLPDSPPEVEKDKNPPCEEVKSVSSPSSIEHCHKELKKHKSVLDKCRKLLHLKIEKKEIEERTEVPQINGLAVETTKKKKKFWKTNKLKLAVAN